MKICITGCTGYIGSHLIKKCESLKYKIVGLSRKKINSEFVEWVYFDLFELSQTQLPDDVDIIIHLATANSIGSQLNIEQESLAAEYLIDKAVKINAMFIFISSQTASAKSHNLYGLSKWQIEKKVLDSGGVVIRPGLVYGGEPKGLFGFILKLVDRFSILPSFIPSPNIQPIHVDDLCECILLISTKKIKSKIYYLGSPHLISFYYFLRQIAQERIRKCRFFLPTPTFLVYIFSFLLSKSYNFKLGIVQLKSLFELPVMNTRQSLDQIKFQLRPLCSGMHPSGNNLKRLMLIEGKIFFSYINPYSMKLFSLRRYVKYVEKFQGGKILNLSKFFLFTPSLVMLFEFDDTKLAWNKSFHQRLDSATFLFEASKEGANLFLTTTRNSFLSSLSKLIKILILEFFGKVFSFFLRPIVRIYIRHINF